MKKIYALLLACFCLLQQFPSQAQSGGNCQAATATSLLDANSVTATVGPGGTLWPEGYVVPNSLPDPVNAIFTGGLWIGGFDPAGNLKMAAQTYSSTFNNEYFPGPLDPTTGETSMETCQNWDLIFKVTQSEIDDFLADLSDNDVLDEQHPSILGWPGRGNTNFSEIHSFDLPDQELAPFVDTDSDGSYNPLNGDYPAIKGDEANWWITNDAGGIHATTMGDPLQFEIQIMAFAHASENPAIDNTTFYDLKITNRSLEPLDSTMITLWVDPDLGCYTDDYVGCSPEHDLAFVYNADDQDGEPGCSCTQGINTYCSVIPVLGIKILESPEQENGEEAGLTTFGAYNNGSVGTMPPATTDPANALEYYRLMSGSWRDGSPFTQGGDGYQDGAPTPYLFPDNPSDSMGWSMCTANLASGDPRILMSTGNIRMEPGESVNVSYAVTLVEAVPHPCPDITPLVDAFDEVEQYYSGLATATEDVELINSQVVAFPNPSREEVQITLKTLDEELEQVILMDAQGKPVRQYNRLSGHQLVIRKENLSAGIYFYQVRTSAGKAANGKVVFL